MKKKCRKLVKKNLEQKKCFKKEEINCTSSGKDMINSWINKKDLE